MSAMGEIAVQHIDWFAVRFRIRNNPGRTTCVIDVERETYRASDGKVRKRAVKGSGRRVFVPELLARRAGFEVFLPVRKEWRRRNQFGAERELRSYPLMPGWMFVGWPSGTCRWADLMALDIVSGVLGTGGRPLRIGEEIMIAAMRQWGGGVVAPELARYMRAGREVFAEGDLVQVQDGPFADFPARVVEIDGPETHVLVKLFGRDTPLVVGTENLEKL